jgi:hypothetical protein
MESSRTRRGGLLEFQTLDSLLHRHSGTRASANPESRQTSFKGWIPGSALRTAPE